MVFAGIILDPYQKTTRSTACGPATVMGQDGSLMQRFEIIFEGQSRRFRAASDRTLLASLVAQGITVLSVGCRNGGCGICRVKVVDGAYRTLAMNRARISREEEKAGIVLACRIVPASDLRVRPLPLGPTGRLN